MAVRLSSLIPRVAVLLFAVHSGAVYVLCVFIMNAPSCVNSQLECVNPHGAYMYFMHP